MVSHAMSSAGCLTVVSTFRWPIADDQAPLAHAQAVRSNDQNLWMSLGEAA